MKKVLLSLLLVLTVLCLSVTAFATEETALDTYKYVVVVGVDGGGTFFRDTDTPNIDRIFADGAITYETVVCSPSVSAAGWCSLLHGSTTRQHGITRNGDAYGTTFPSDSKYPSLFRVIREVEPEAKLGSFVGWDVINLNLIEKDFDVYQESALTLEQLTANTPAYAVENKPRFLFVQINEVDEVGHGSGYGNANHLAAITEADAYIGTLYDAYVDAGMAEDTLFIVTADHGGIGSSHGGWTEEERYVMFAAAGKTVQKGTIGDMAIRDTAAIVLHALGIEQPATWSARVPDGVFEGVSAQPRTYYNDPDTARYHESVATPEAGTEAYISNFVDRDLKMYMPMDGDLSDVYGADGLGFGNIEYAEGYFGDALVLDNGYVALGQTELLADSFTVAFWMRTEGLMVFDHAPAVPYILANKSGLSGLNPGMALSLYAHQKVTLNFADGVNRMDMENDLPADFYEGWTHVMLTVDRENNKIGIGFDFYDFAECDIPEAMADAVVSGAYPFYLGQDSTRAHYELPALIDEFMIFDGAMTREEARSLAAYYGVSYENCTHAALEKTESGYACLQCGFAMDAVRVDGTGATEHAYTTLEAAVAALPDAGGEIIVCGDTAMAVGSALVLPEKSGKVTVTGKNGAKFKLAYSMKLGSDMEFDNIELVNANNSWGAILACGHELTMGAGVTTSIENTNNRAIAIYGGDTGSVTTDYDAHIVLKGGTWRSVYGGHHKGTFNGTSTVEVSNVTMTHKLSAKCESGTFNGTAKLIADLRSGKTVTAATYLETPTFLVDEGYEAELDGTTYKQTVESAPVTVYVDGTGATADAYTSFEEALAALPLSGGTIYVSGDTTVGVAGEPTDLASKNGKVTVIGQNGAKLINPRTWLLGNEYEFKSINLHSTSSGNAFIYANGHKLTIAEDVTTTVASGARYMTIFGGVSTASTETYNTHLVIKAGTYRNIAGGNYMTAFIGTSKVELSNVTVERRLSAKNQDGNKTFTGTSELILDLRGNKTVTATTWAEAPTTVLVDKDYTYTLDGTTYKQTEVTVLDTVYVDDTGATEGAYTSFEAAYGALPDAGGTICVYNETTIGTPGSTYDLAEKSGKVTIIGQADADGVLPHLIVARTMCLGCETEIDNVVLCSPHSGGWGYIYAMGHKLTVGENVTTCICDVSGAWYPSIYGGVSTADDNTYNTHLVVRSGRYRFISGANYGTAFTGTTKVEVSNVTVENTLTAKNRNASASFTGTAELILDLRGNKTVTAGTYAETPTTVLVDEGYTYTLDGTTYKQTEDEGANTVYLDGTGATEGAYTKVEDAVAALPVTGGTVIVTGDTTVGTASSALTLPQKNGKVTFTSENGSKLIIARTLIMSGDVEFNNVGLFSSATDKGYLYAEGHTLTIGENVTTGKTVDAALLIAIFGGTHTSNAMSTDSHLTVRSGTYRAIYGGSYSAAFTGKSTVEVSGITVEDTLTAGNYSGSAYAGTPVLIVDLRGGKTVTAGSIPQEMTILVDSGYEAVVTDKTYSQQLLHSHSYKEEVTEPTCGTAGYTLFVCACGDHYTEGIPATGKHSYDDGVTDPENAGVKIYTCTVCGDTYTEEIPTEPVLGDMNGDGAVTVVDVLVLVKAVLNGDAAVGGDLSGDGAVTLIDVIRLMKMITA